GIDGRPPAAGVPTTLLGVDGHSRDPVAMRNVISGNAIGGADAEGYVVVAGNYIGTDASGTQRAGNSPNHGSGEGLELDAFGSVGHILVGSDGDGVGDDYERNVISGNGGLGGIIVFGSGNQIAGNYIGTNAMGMNIPVATPGGYSQQNGVSFGGGSHDNWLG